MSSPSFPENPGFTRDDAVNQILSSIAMEELGLSHIINAEGEKIQYALGTLPGVTGPGATIEDVLSVNTSVQNTLQAAATNQMFLNQKMSNALNSSVLQGPMGPQGVTGPAGNMILTIFDAANTGNYTAGEVIWFNNDVYVVNVDNPTGLPGTSTDYTMLSNPRIIPYEEISLNSMPTNVANPAASTISLTTNAYTIPFDTVAPGATLNLGYTAANQGVFTLQPGSYLVSYWVNVGAVINNDILYQAIALDVLVNGAVNSQSIVAYAGGGVVSSQNNSASSIVNVTDANTTLSITFPVQNGSFRFSGSTPQAGVSFAKLG